MYSNPTFIWKVGFLWVREGSLFWSFGGRKLENFNIWKSQGLVNKTLEKVISYVLRGPNRFQRGWSSIWLNCILCFLGAKKNFFKKCSKNGLVSKKNRKYFYHFLGGGWSDPKVIKITFFFLKPSLNSEKWK